MSVLGFRGRGWGSSRLNNPAAPDSRPAAPYLCLEVKRNASISIGFGIVGGASFFERRWPVAI
jgi:hypothetical protein